MWIIFLIYFVPFITLSEQVVWNLPANFSRINVDHYVYKYLCRQNPPYESTDCNRTCVVGQNRVCYQKFHVEHYQAMGAACGNCSLGVLADCSRPQCVTADGVETGIMTINRKVPGPLIEVCQGDLVVIDVINQLNSDTISIHWHGVRQRGTPYMDGVPYVTQEPIIPKETFRYTLWADDIGTQFYHSYSGKQRHLGIYGGFIVRSQPSVENIVPNIYTDDNQVVILSDWSHESPDTHLVGLPTRPDRLPESILINGKGKYLNLPSNTWTNSPYETIYVQANGRHRARIISALSMECPVEMQIQNHRMQVIAFDGSPNYPVSVDTLVMVAGERYDVVIIANQPPGLYWIHTRLIGACAGRNISQSAILSYIAGSGISGSVPTTPKGPYPRNLVLSDPFLPCGFSTTNGCPWMFVNSGPIGPIGLANSTLYWTFGTRQINTTQSFFAQNNYTPFWNTERENIYLSSINGISFRTPHRPLLHEDPWRRHNLCNSSNLPNSCTNNTVCRCTHAITLTQNSVVDIVLIDESPTIGTRVHSVHFHGYKFYVMGQGQIVSNGSLTVDQIRTLDSQGALRPGNSRPALKDTIAIPSHGFVVLRLVADNPGVWLAHCDVDDDLNFGMALVIINKGKIPHQPPPYEKCEHRHDHSHEHGHDH